jgi:hypothetical protein
VDVSQSLGDRGWSEVSFDEALIVPNASIEHVSPTAFNAVFRSSPDIVNLAFTITSSAATLFTNFHDPLTIANSAFTLEEERKCARPAFLSYASDEEMFAGALSRAESMCEEMHCTRAEVAIVVFGTNLFADLLKHCRNGNKAIEEIKERGDHEAVKRARQSGRFVVSTPDYIGGLEFSGVILVGVDKGRVPPRTAIDTPDSENFASYASHQRLYVAITRAKYRVEILGLAARGPSQMLQPSIDKDLLLVERQ